MNLDVFENELSLPFRLTDLIRRSLH